MDDPFEVLGIAPTDDEREIKRAYARLIKVHRPDRDPTGFERVHRAYEAALGTSERAWETPPPVRTIDDSPTDAQAPAPASCPDPTMPWSELREHLDAAPEDVAAAVRARFEHLY